MGSFVFDPVLANKYASEKFRYTKLFLMLILY